MKAIAVAVAVWLLAVAAVTGAQRQASRAAERQSDGAAWLVRAFDGAQDREQRGDILDTPVLAGSVMKLVTLAAALESRAIAPDTAHLCRRSFTADGIRYTCAHPDLKRPLTAVEALAHSCNDFFVSLAPRLSRASVNELRARIGLPPIGAGANFAAALVGLDGPRVAPRALLDAVARLVGAGDARPAALAASTRRALLDGMRGAATYGSASELGVRGVSALAKTGTAVMPGGGTLGLVVAFTPTERSMRGLVVVAPGAAGRDAVSIAGDLLADAGVRLRVGMTGPGGRVRAESIALEDYVARVVAGESPPRAPDAAQRALAIAARTFALANRGRHDAEGFDLCDTTHCQVLRAATVGGTRAVMATAGRVLLQGGRPAPVFYSAWCGGRSALASEVWPGAVDHAFAASRPDDACASEPTWTSELTAAEVERALRAAGRRGDRLRDLRVVTRTPSGRVARLSADGFAPSEISGEDFRTAVGRVIGWERLKSTAFELRRSASGYRMSGRGSGHGVGMCVLGAGTRAARGATAEQILAFYYPGLRVATYEASAAGMVDAGDVRVALPAAEEGERALVSTLVRRARDEVAAAAGVAPPAAIRVTVHPNVDAFSRATGRPWWVAGATRGGSIELIPIAALRREGQFERTIRHEVAHVVIDPVLEDRPLWVREGAAMRFDGAGAVTAPRSNAPCPADAELLRPASAEAQRDAYARASACFARQIAAGRSWRQVR